MLNFQKKNILSLLKGASLFVLSTPIPMVVSLLYLKISLPKIKEKGRALVVQGNIGQAQFCLQHPAKILGLARQCMALMTS